MPDSITRRIRSGRLQCSYLSRPFPKRCNHLSFRLHSDRELFFGGLCRPRNTLGATYYRPSRSSAVALCILVSTYARDLAALHTTSPCLLRLVCRSMCRQFVPL